VSANSTGRDAAFTLPAALVAQGYALRHEADGDMPFLRRLYASTRSEELAIVKQWSDDDKLGFLNSQFDLQRYHYRKHFPSTFWGVVEHLGVPVGRIYIDRQDDALHVLDIALLPEARGRGAGTALMQWLCAEAAATGKAVAIAVEKFNRAQSLYERLGFHDVSDGGAHRFMEWRASTTVS
jgi:ribosomal protein S18 acetylase RimI-like enzyme